MKTDKDEIIVKDPNIIGAPSIPAERIPLGIPGDCKPSIALLPNGEILLTAYHHHRDFSPYSYTGIYNNIPIKKDIHFEGIIYRSKDGGLTWSERNTLHLSAGMQQPFISVTKNGTLFITHFFDCRGVGNLYDYSPSFISRSEDNGYSWETRRIGREEICSPNARWIFTSMNVAEAPGGRLLLAVSDDQLHSYIWGSSDDGKNWIKQRFSLRDDKEGLFAFWYGFFCEAYLWYSKHGKLLIFCRTESAHYPIKGQPAPEKHDFNHRTVLFESNDDGRTAKKVKDFGNYGEMYPSILRLKNDRLLYTFSSKCNKPLGVRACLGKETEEGGVEFDLQQDRIILETRTPDNQTTGSGHGNTVQLADETLVTPYSYRGSDGRRHMEIVRWKLDL